MSKLGIKNDGTLWGWGDNFQGELGLGDTIPYSLPTQVGSLTNWSELVIYEGSAFSVKQDGTLWSWGNNENGQLGLGDCEDRFSPCQVGSLTDWKTIVSHSESFFALKTDGTIWAWGANYSGQLGLGDYENRSSPCQVGALTDWTELFSTDTGVYAKKTNGTLWVTLNDTYNSILDYGVSSFTQVGNPNEYEKIYDHGAIKIDGTLWEFQSSPVQIGSDVDWYELFSNGYTFLALKNNKTLWSWGENYSGQLGLGDIENRSFPTQIGSSMDWDTVYLINDAVLATKTEGSLWGWGYISLSGLSGSKEYILNPTQLLGFYDVVDVDYDYLNGSIDMICDHINPEEFNTPVGNNLWSGNSSGSGSAYLIGSSYTSWKDVSIGLWDFLYMIQEDGTLWEQTDDLHKISSDTDWTQISAGAGHCLALKEDGSLWSWGVSNSYGQLGLGHDFNISSPTQVGSLTTWSQVSGGYLHSMALKEDGTLWGWGANGYGQLGLGDTIDIFSPTQVGSLTIWSYVSSGLNFTMGIKEDGTLWGWGDNENGQLGLGDCEDRFSPCQVGALTDWYRVSCGEGHCLAIKQDGTLWSWGYNSPGQLGLDDYDPRSSPCQVGSGTSWTQVSAGASISLGMTSDESGQRNWLWGYYTSTTPQEQQGFSNCLKVVATPFNNDFAVIGSYEPHSSYE